MCRGFSEQGQKPVRDRGGTGSGAEWWEEDLQVVPRVKEKLVEQFQTQSPCQHYSCSTDR